MSTFFLALFLALFTGLMIVFASLAMGGTTIRSFSVL